MTAQDELERIKVECTAMMKTLQELQEEEISLRYQNRILAREILNFGYTGELETVVKPPPSSSRSRGNSKTKNSSNDSPTKSSSKKQ